MAKIDCWQTRLWLTSKAYARLSYEAQRRNMKPTLYAEQLLNKTIPNSVSGFRLRRNPHSDKTVVIRVYLDRNVSSWYTLSGMLNIPLTRLLTQLIEDELKL